MANLNHIIADRHPHTAGACGEIKAPWTVLVEGLGPIIAAQIVEYKVSVSLTS